MKDRFLNSSISFITSYKQYSKKDIEKLRYGLEGIYLTIYKLFIILIISLILGILKETLIFLVLFNIIRFPAFGFHANTSLECLIISSILILGIPFLFLNLYIPLYVKIIISIICLICYILYAPADTVKRPLPNKKKRIIRKICSIICCLIYIGLMIVFKNSYINNLFLSAIIVETILIIPITYKIFRQSYRNYLNMV